MRVAHITFHSCSQAYFGLYDGHGGRETVDYVVKIMHLVCSVPKIAYAAHTSLDLQTLEHLLINDPTMPVSKAFTEAYLVSARKFVVHCVSLLSNAAH